MHGVAEWLFLVAAGTVAGVIGTAGGITSLVAYPALLAVGIPPLAANITNSVAMLGSGFGSAVRARADLPGRARTLQRWVPGMVVLSVAGAVLLVVTPSAAFTRIVPLLIAGGSVILLLQPMIAMRRARREVPPPPQPLLVGAFAAGIALYNGYFGAGAGILLIALLVLTTEPVLHRANALKNVILFASDLLPAGLFAVLGTVVWQSALPLGLGALAGGLIGPTIARRVPAAVIRVLVGTCGLGFAVWLLLHP